MPHFSEFLTFAFAFSIYNLYLFCVNMCSFTEMYAIFFFTGTHVKAEACIDTNVHAHICRKIVRADNCFSSMQFLIFFIERTCMLFQYMLYSTYTCIINLCIFICKTNCTLIFRACHRQVYIYSDICMIMHV